MSERIHVILPTRGAPQKVRRLVESLERTTERPDLLTIWLAYDKEDRQPRFRSPYALPFTVEVLEFETEGLARAMRGAIEFALQGIGSSDELVLLAGDDFTMETESWDEKVRAEFPPAPEPVMGWFRDGLQNEKLATHNLFRASTLRAIDLGFHGEWQARNDTWLWCLFSLFRTLGRALLHYFPGIYFHHHWHGENPRQVATWPEDHELVSSREAWAYAELQAAGIEELLGMSGIGVYDVVPRFQHSELVFVTELEPTGAVRIRTRWGGDPEPW